MNASTILTISLGLSLVISLQRYYFLVNYACLLILPPTSTQRRPDEKEDTASEGTDGLLRQTDGVEYQCQNNADAYHGEYAERFGGDFHRLLNNI